MARLFDLSSTRTLQICLKSTVSLGLMLCLSTQASAHVSVQPKTTGSGPFKAVFRVPHGCEGQATTGVRIVIPEGIIGVKPQPKPGWNVQTTKGKHARAYDYFHGRKEAEGVKEVAWTEGNLPNDFFDEFAIVGFVTDGFTEGQKAYFKIYQTCATGQLDWVEIPLSDDPETKLKSPAPAITIEGAQHHHH